MNLQWSFRKSRLMYSGEPTCAHRLGTHHHWHCAVTEWSLLRALLATGTTVCVVGEGLHYRHNVQTYARTLSNGYKPVHDQYS